MKEFDIIFPLETELYKKVLTIRKWDCTDKSGELLRKEVLRKRSKDVIKNIFILFDTVSLSKIVLEQQNICRPFNFLCSDLSSL